jgi:hypothetical protein
MAVYNNLILRSARPADPPRINQARPGDQMGME